MINPDYRPCCWRARARLCYRGVVDELMKTFAGVGGMSGSFPETRAAREQQVGTPERRAMFKKAGQIAYGDRELVDSREAAGVALLGSVGAGAVMFVAGWVCSGVWHAIF